MNDELKTFLISYHHDGADWILELKALDADDARTRLRVLPLARIDGELIAKVPSTLGPLTAVATFVRNGLFRLSNAYPRLGMKP